MRTGNLRLFASVTMLAAAAWPVGAAEVTYQISPHVFEGEDGVAIGAEWGRLIVPENRTKGGSNLIEVPFIRFRTGSSNPGVPVVFLSGGPGEETLDTVGQFLPFVSDLPADFILIEQRGVGHSRPLLDCAGNYSLGLDQPLDMEILRDAERSYAWACAEFWQGRGVDLSGYNVREMAADIDALRQALGYEKINVLGGSFGSHHGIAVLRYFGDHVHRAILSAVEGPNHTVKLPSTIQRYLVLLDQKVAADPHLSDEIPSLLDLMSEVLTELERNPVTVSVTGDNSEAERTITVGKLDLQMVTARGLGSTSFVADLPARYHAMSKGDFSWLASEAVDYRTDRGGALMSNLVDCASGASPGRRAQIHNESSEALLGNSINGTQFEVCDVIAASDLGSEFRTDLVSDVPTLLISGSLDPRTPVSNALEVMEGLPNGQHLTLQGVSHDFEMASEFLIELVQTQMGFLLGQSPEETEIRVPFEFARVEKDRE